MGMQELTLSFSTQTILILLAIVATISVVGFTYRHSIPPLSPGFKILLASLRALAMALIVFLIAEPVLSLILRDEERPLVVILADDSRSMTIEDGGVSRASRQRSLLTSDNLQAISNEALLLSGSFSNRLRMVSSSLADSLTYSGAQTNLGGALEELKVQTADRNLRAIILLSDGNITSGVNPLLEIENMNAPLFTIGIGDTLQRQDLLVRKVVTNNIAYAGSRVPVQVTLRKSGYGGERIEVALNEEGKVVDRQVVVLSEQQDEYMVPMSFTAGEEGTHQYTVSLSQLANEVNILNNRSTFYTKVLKSKMKITLVAGSPGSDQVFIMRALESDQNVELTTLMERRDGLFDGGATAERSVREADCLVLVGFPTSATRPEALSMIAASIQRGKGLFLVLSRTINLEKLKALESLLPMGLERFSSDELLVHVVVPEHQRNNPVVRLRPGAAQLSVWSDLPPIFTRQVVGNVKPEADVLALKRVQGISTSEPLIVSRSTPQQKSLLFLGYGIWRWKMMTGETPGAPGALEQFLSQSVRWLTTRTDDRQVRVTPLTDVFAGGDPVEFTGQVYDLNMRPLENAIIAVHVTGNEQRYDVSLSSIGQGQYEGSLDGLPSGDYRYSASASSDGVMIGESKGTFSIGGAEAEFVETRMNKELLQQLAYRSGGKYYDAEDTESLADDIRALPGFESRERRMAAQYQPWDEPWPYALIILLLALEWMLRKRSGLL